ncbi:MarR family winged helix-turn-helix transcriptional regulator [Amycolatopsis samaneae]|uniref:MarR family winged helix-turn-helix transcriptional regulator n=1 Tax=Amycolatopsis samaneae TaxID=664691 RepID=A0ABW5GU31_9PSEU
MATEKLRPLEDEAWRGFLLTHDRILRAMEEGLAPLNVSLPEYSVLALLGEAGPNGMRMSELAERRVMSTGGLTRLADRLERRGLVRRQRSDADGRGFEMTLTGEGRALLRKAWRRHHGDLRELFFDRLGDDDLRHLAEVWNRLAAEPG